MKNYFTFFTAIIFSLSSFADTVNTDSPSKTGGDIGIDENLGSLLDLNLHFLDENGQSVLLKNFFTQQKPVILIPIYLACPALCSLHLNGVIEALKKLPWKAGRDYQLIAFSFEPKEGPDLALAKKQNYIRVYGSPNAEEGWHFLTTDVETIRKLTSQIGFRYSWNENRKEWVHASAAIILTPDGVISRYLHGVQFDPLAFTLSLTEAAQGKIGTISDRVLTFCYTYDSQQGGYFLSWKRVLPLLGGILILFFIIAIYGLRLFKKLLN